MSACKRVLLYVLEVWLSVLLYIGVYVYGRRLEAVEIFVPRTVRGVIFVSIT